MSTLSLLMSAGNMKDQRLNRTLSEYSHKHAKMLSSQGHINGDMRKIALLVEKILKDIMQFILEWERITLLDLSLIHI